MIRDRRKDGGRIQALYKCLEWTFEMALIHTGTTFHLGQKAPTSSVPFFNPKEMFRSFRITLVTTMEGTRLLSISG